MSLLEVSDLSVTYPGGAVAVRQVSFVVDENECLGVVGESGSGKTSMILAILGLLPTGATITGSIRLADEEMVDAPPARRRALLGSRVGFVPQDPFAACDPLRAVRDHVGEAWRARGLRPEPGAVDSLLREVGLDVHQGGLRPHQWSGGMLQRATIAAASAHRPALIVADEPTSALDAGMREEILCLLRSRSRSLVLVSHDLALVGRHSDRVVVIYAGRVVESGSAASVVHRPRHPFTVALAAAVPRRGGGLPKALEGDSPDPRLPEIGCPFCPRCALALPGCSQTVPDLVGGVACPVVRGVSR